MNAPDHTAVNPTFYTLKPYAQSFSTACYLFILILFVCLPDHQKLCQWSCQLSMLFLKILIWLFRCLNVSVSQFIFSSYLQGHHHKTSAEAFPSLCVACGTHTERGSAYRRKTWNWYGSMGTGRRRVTGGVVKVLERGGRASIEEKPGKEAEKPQNPHHHHFYHLSCSYRNQQDLFTS